MNWRKFYFRTVAVGVTFWFLETWYFGWNLKAQSKAEIICDMLSQCFIILGFSGLWFHQDDKR